MDGIGKVNRTLSALLKRENTQRPTAKHTNFLLMYEFNVVPLTAPVALIIVLYQFHLQIYVLNIRVFRMNGLLKKIKATKSKQILKVSVEEYKALMDSVELQD